MSEKKCFICKELEIYDNGKTCYSCDEDSYNIGKKQGAVEELERLVDEVKKKDYCQDFLYYSILKRLKELKEVK
jgi:argonaute-like protein implicated in RNA metabolism and viral defense